MAALLRWLWIGWALLAVAAPAAAQLRLAVSQGPVSLPIYVAQSRHYFADEGLAVTLVDCSSGQQALQLLAGGQADLATAAELPVVLQSLAGADNAIVATLSASTQHIKLVARRDAGMRGPADLRGRRIATVAGSSAQYFLDSWLVYHDIDPQQVQIRTLPPDQLIPALQHNEIDALAIWEPIAGNAIALLAQQALVLPNPRIYTQHFNLVAPRRLIAGRGAELVKLLRALQRAQRWIAAQPEPAVRLAAEHLKGEAGPANLAEHEFRLALDQHLIATMEGQARWALRGGLANAPRDAGNLLRLIAPEPLRQAVPGAVSLVQ